MWSSNSSRIRLCTQLGHQDPSFRTTVGESLSAQLKVLLQKEELVRGPLWNTRSCLMGASNKWSVVSNGLLQIPSWMKGNGAHKVSSKSFMNIKVEQKIAPLQCLNWCTEFLKRLLAKNIARLRPRHFALIFEIYTFWPGIRRNWSTFYVTLICRENGCYEFFNV